MDASRWSWECRKKDGTRVPVPEGTVFAIQSDAETWLGENWRLLVAQGAEYAELIENGRDTATYSLPMAE